MYLAATIQYAATSDEVENIAVATRLIKQAASSGASLITTPEASNYLGPHKQKVAQATTLEGPVVAHFSQLARKHGVHLLLGSFNEKSDDVRRCYNTSVLFGPDGDILGHYRKMHLFDANVPPTICFAESDTTKAGVEPIVVDTVLGNIGLSICYDLRFPEYYAKLVALGAEIIAVPAAFTMTTGKDHWHPLLRARAIETQSYIIAPDQYGEHDDDGLRESYGHSMIVDPWGQVIAMVPNGQGVAIAPIDLERVRSIRAAMPVHTHRRL